MPRSVHKSVADILEGAVTPGKKKGAKSRWATQPVEEPDVALSPEAMAKRIEELENTMMDHARNLEFEEAAAVRDQISRFKR